MDAQSESCETPPLSDPQAPGKIRKAFKLFGKGKPGSGVASIFTRRGKGEGAPKSPLSRSKTLDGLSENATATQDAPESATMSEPTASTQQKSQQQQEGGDANESAQNEQPSAGESKVDPASSPTRPSISSISSAKSLGFLSLLRRGRRGGGAGGGGEGDRQVCTEAHRGGRQRKGLRSLFGSMRWRRHDGDETDEGAGPPLTASRSNSVEIIKEHLTLTPRPAPRAEGERDLDESTLQSQAPSSLPATPKPSTPKTGAEDKLATSLLNPNASGAEPTSDRLSTLLGDISSILSFDSLTGCGDIVADVEAEWAKASSRVGASATATKDRSDDTDSGEKSLSSSATPSGKLSPAPTPAPATTTPTPLITTKPVAALGATAPPSITIATKPASPAAAAPSPPPFMDSRAPATPVPVQSPSPALSASSLSASPSISKPEPKPAPTAAPAPSPAPISAPAPSPTPVPAPSPATTTQAAPAAPKSSTVAAAGPKSAPPAAPGPKFTTGQVSGGKQTTASGKPKIVTTFGLSCNRIRTSPPTKPASGADTKPLTPTTKSAPVSTFSESTTSAAAAAAVMEPAPSAKAHVTPAVAFSIPAAAHIPSAPAAYKPPPSYTATPALTTSHPVSTGPKTPAFPEPSMTIPPATAPSTRPLPVASPVSPPSPLPPLSPPPAVSPPVDEARVDGGEDLASREALRETPSQRAIPVRREEPPLGMQEQTPSPGVAGGPGALVAKRSPVVKPATLSKIPVSGGGRPPGAAVRPQQIPTREAHSNGDAAAAMSWGPPTPVGFEEDVLHPLSRDTGSRDTLSEFAGQSPATSPPTSPHDFDDDRVPHTPSPPGASASRPSSKIGVPSGIPRDSKIPIKRDTPVAPVYHSVQGKGEAPRTKIPVSKVPVRRGGHTAVRK